MSAPEVLEFDGQGNLIKSWGGRAKAMTGRQRSQVFSLEQSGNVWITGNGAKDRRRSNSPTTGIHIADRPSVRGADG